MQRIALIIVLIVLAGCSASPYRQGCRLADSGRFGPAVERFREEIEIEPNAAAGWRELGVALYREGDLAQAEDALLQAKRLAPDVRTFLYLGLVHERQDEMELALAAYRRAVQLEPGGAVAEALRPHIDLLADRNAEAAVDRAIAGTEEIDAASFPPNSVGLVIYDTLENPLELPPLSKGFTELTIADLKKIESLDVVDRLEMEAILARLPLGSADLSDPARTVMIGMLAGAQRMVTGGMRSLGSDAIRIDGSVVDCRDAGHEPTAPAVGGLERFFEIQKDFVFAVIAALGIVPTLDEIESIEKVPTRSFEAFLAYCRGLDLKDSGDFEEAEKEFRFAATVDLMFEEAWHQADNAADRYTATPGNDAARLVFFEAAATAASDALAYSKGFDRFQEIMQGLSGFVPDTAVRDLGSGAPDQRPRVPNVSIVVRGHVDGQQ